MLSKAHKVIYFVFFFHLIFVLFSAFTLKFLMVCKFMPSSFTQMMIETKIRKLTSILVFFTGPPHFGIQTHTDTTETNIKTFLFRILTFTLDSAESCAYDTTTNVFRRKSPGKFHSHGLSQAQACVSVCARNFVI